MSTQQISAQRFFDDVSTGDEYVEHHNPTTERVVEFMSSMNDERGGRFTDTAAARAQGLHAAIVPGTMSTAMIYRTVTNYMGPLGRVVSLDISFRRPILHGDLLSCTAVVTDTTNTEEIAAGVTPVVTIDLLLNNDKDEKPVQGTAVIELPRR